MQRTVGCTEQRRVLPVDAQPDRQNCEHVKQHDAEERCLDGARNRLPRTRRLAGGDRNEFHAAKRVKCVHKCLCKVGESTDEGLAVLEVGEAGSWVVFYPAPVIDEAHDDKEDDHDHLDGRKPVFGFTYLARE